MRDVAELDKSLKDLIENGSSVSREYQRLGKQRQRVVVKQIDFDSIMQEYANYGINAIDNTFIQRIVGFLTTTVQLRIQRCLRNSDILTAIEDFSANNNKRYYVTGTEPKEPKSESYKMSLSEITGVTRGTKTRKEFVERVETFRFLVSAESIKTDSKSE